MSTPRCLGLTDEVTACDCCGRTNLKSTVAISLDGESDPVYYGSQCAERALAGKGMIVKATALVNTAKEITRLKTDMVRAKAELARFTDMQAQGHTRYVIGGKEIGAELGYLIESRKKDVQMYEVRLRKLETL